MRLLLVALPLIVLAACGRGETSQPSATPDERIEYWAELFAQRQLEHNRAFVCAAINQPAGSFGGGDDAAIVDQVPTEIAEAVSMRIVTKLQEKCAAEKPPDCGWTCYIQPSPTN
jgi:hypothetical protein